MNRFAAIRSERAAADASVPDEPDVSSKARAATRVGKKAISGYFSPDLSRALHILALERDTSLQALMGEAFDDLMRKYAKHPFGER